MPAPTLASQQPQPSIVLDAAALRRALSLGPAVNEGSRRSEPWSRPTQADVLASTRPTAGAVYTPYTTRPAAALVATNPVLAAAAAAAPPTVTKAPTATPATYSGIAAGVGFDPLRGCETCVRITRPYLTHIGTGAVAIALVIGAAVAISYDSTPTRPHLARYALGTNFEAANRQVNAFETANGGGDTGRTDGTDGATSTGGAGYEEWEDPASSTMDWYHRLDMRAIAGNCTGYVVTHGRVPHGAVFEEWKVAIKNALELNGCPGGAATTLDSSTIHQAVASAYHSAILVVVAYEQPDITDVLRGICNHPQTSRTRVIFAGRTALTPGPDIPQGSFSQGCDLYSIDVELQGLAAECAKHVYADIRTHCGVIHYPDVALIDARQVLGNYSDRGDHNAPVSAVTSFMETFRDRWQVESNALNDGHAVAPLNSSHHSWCKPDHLAWDTAQITYDCDSSNPCSIQADAIPLTLSCDVTGVSLTIPRPYLCGISCSEAQTNASSVRKIAALSQSTVANRAVASTIIGVTADTQYLRVV